VSRYRYHVVPFIGTINRGVFSKENADTVSAQLQSVIDHYGEHGWDYCRPEKVHFQINPGCLGSLLGGPKAPQLRDFDGFEQSLLRSPF